MKNIELRVVYIDGVFHAFSINSQDKEYTKVDWRYGNVTLEFWPCELDADVKVKLSAFMSEMKLFYGHFDLIVDKDGEHWFLECNPDGQWMWLDLIVDGAISDSFANAFYHRITRNNHQKSTTMEGV